MVWKVSLLLAVCQGIVLFLAIGVSSNPVVRIGSTQIFGNEMTYENEEVHEFLGIPYAEPPVGDLRFQKTQTLRTFPRRFKAFYPAPACRQYTETAFPWYFNDPYKSEDCLYLNIWKPAAANPENLKAVLIVIYSGNFKFGSSSLDFYSGLVFSALTNTIVVTFNYRIGSFGFLSSGTKDAPGNAGLYDVKELLEWCSQYISFFGGDPSQITIFGESTAATIAGYLTLKEETQSLFSRLIMQSGSPVNLQTNTNQKNKDLGKKLAKLAGCKEDDWDEFGPSTIQCLKNVPEEKMEYIEYKMAPNSSFGFHPIIDGDFLQDNPRKSILKGNFHCKQLLIGNNRDEGTVILSVFDSKSFGFHGEKDLKVNADIVKKILGLILNVLADIPPILSDVLKTPDVQSPPAMPAITDNPLLNKIPDLKSAVTVPAPVDKLTGGLPNFVSPLLDSILGDSSSNPNCMRHQLSSAVGDIVLLCPTRYFAEKCAEQGMDVYYYYFVHRTSNSPFAKWMGVTHFSEVQYVFGKPLSNTDDYTDDEKSLSRLIIQHWGDFVKYGKPDPSWPKYTKEKPIYKVLDVGNGTRPYGKGPHTHNCDLLRESFSLL